MKTISTIKTSSIVAALVGGLLLSFVGNASATLSLDYTLDSSNDPQASIYYNQNDRCLYGSNIAVSSITGIGTTQTTQNTQTITGGFLNFVTGPLTGTTGNIWNFAQGGSITVTGGFNNNVSTPLLSGAFDSVSVTQMPLNGLPLTFAIVGGTFSAVGSQSIYNYFNIPSDSTSASGINLSFLATSGITNNSLTSNSIASGNIVNVLCNDPAPTPIPAAAWLLGSGLLGLAGLRSRRLAIM
ncbi:MAG: hypothetical protein ABSA86_06220 [Oryzomonas sp.]